MEEMEVRAREVHQSVYSRATLVHTLGEEEGFDRGRTWIHPGACGSK